MPIKYSTYQSNSKLHINMHKLTILSIVENRTPQHFCYCIGAMTLYVTVVYYTTFQTLNLSCDSCLKLVDLTVNISTCQHSNFKLNFTQNHKHVLVFFVLCRADNVGRRNNTTKNNAFCNGNKIGILSIFNLKLPIFQLYFGCSSNLNHEKKIPKL